MSFQVYVIENASGRFYIGVSENVEARLRQHNDGISRWTRGKGLWRLVWRSPEMQLGEARRLENELKRQKGGNGFYERTGLQRRAGS